MNDWRKSSRSNGQGQCVEVGWSPGRVGIRDSKDPGGAHLIVRRPVFDALLEAVRTERLS